MNVARPMNAAEKEVARHFAIAQAGGECALCGKRCGPGSYCCGCGAFVCLAHGEPESDWQTSAAFTPHAPSDHRS